MLIAPETHPGAAAETAASPPRLELVRPTGNRIGDRNRPAMRLVGPIPVSELAVESVVERFGADSVSPFLVGPQMEQVRLSHGVAGFAPRGRWAVAPTTPACLPGREADAVLELLDHLGGRRMRLAVAAAPDPSPFLEAGMFARPIADDAVVDLEGFGLGGKARASIRHSVSSARRAGIRIVSWEETYWGEVHEVSEAWLAGKRGGEMTFTLGQPSRGHLASVDTRIALDATGRVCGFCTWRRFDRGRCRVLDIMRRTPSAPNPTMDLLIAESLLDFAGSGVLRASLGSVPRSVGATAERIYPTRSLRRYKDKFTPEWEPRYLIAPSRRDLPGATLALARAFNPDGVLRLLLHNG